MLPRSTVPDMTLEIHFRPKNCVDNIMSCSGGTVSFYVKSIVRNVLEELSLSRSCLLMNQEKVRDFGKRDKRVGLNSFWIWLIPNMTHSTGKACDRSGTSPPSAAPRFLPRMLCEGRSERTNLLIRRGGC